jgi:hypothetical protein
MPGQVSVRNGPVGNPAPLKRVAAEFDCQAWRTSLGLGTEGNASVITQNRPTRIASGTLIPAEACRLRGHGQCLERREETTSLSSGTAGLVAAAHPASDRETASAYLKAARIAVRPPSGWGRCEPKPANEVITDFGAAKPDVSCLMPLHFVQRYFFVSTTLRIREKERRQYKAA